MAAAIALFFHDVLHLSFKFFITTHSLPLILQKQTVESMLIKLSILIVGTCIGI